MSRPPLQLHFTDPFPILESERLLFRRLVKEDVGMVLRMRSDAQTMRYIPRPLVANEAEALSHIAAIDERIENNTGINWAVAFRDRPNDAIGIMGLFRIEPENFRAEIGYMILREHWGKGVVTEALGPMLDYGFGVMGLHSVEAVIDPANTASARVLEKNGFSKEAHFIENEYFDGKFIDSAVFSLLAATERCNPEKKIPSLQ